MVREIPASRIISALNVGVVVLQGDGSVASLNPAAAQILGLDAAEAQGKPLAQVLPEHDSNQPLLSLARDLVESGQELDQSEAEYHHPGGKPRQLLVSGWPEGGEGWVLVLEDVSHAAELAEAGKAQQQELRVAYQKLEAQNQSLKEAQARGWRMKLAAAALLLAFIGALIWWYEVDYLPQEGSPTSSEQAAADQDLADFRTAQAQTQDLMVTVPARGMLEPLEMVTVSAQAGGHVEALDFKLGQEVPKGQVLLRLDQRELLPKVRNAESALLKARAKMNELENWHRRPEFKQAQRGLDMARRELERKERQLAETQRLHKLGIVAGQDLENARAAVLQAQHALATSTENLSKAKEQASPAQLRIARLDLLNAKLALDEAKAQLASTVVRAPVAGVVMPPMGGDRPGRLPERGAKVAEGQALLCLGSLSHLGVKALVDESEVRRIAVGGQAMVTVPALGPRKLEARVVSVAPQAQNRSSSPQFPVVVELTKLPAELRGSLRLGMSASVLFIASQARGAVVVPIPAVNFDDGSPRVRLPSGQGSRWQAVKTGISDHEFVQITSGLKPGQKILY
ncbi:MAG: efflux RND transporter periplasmic adaptor subunit [Desulfarculaceae bacterium]|nr:efflux RND transporter periplasmic adaptor subunit [Desulfarculaceae bacterium]